MTDSAAAADTLPATASVTEMANAIRFLTMDAVEKAKSGHPGMPMGMADVATVLFTRFMKFDPRNPRWPDRDRFVLSAGHGSMLLYSLLYLTGYADCDIEQIKNFRQLGARTAGHPEYGHISGAETTTGPLGQGLATAVGMAIAEKMAAARYGAKVVDHYTYVIAGDGCLMEGISQEAISLAGHLRLNKLILMWDDNDISIDGHLNISTSDDQLMRFQASGWNVCRVDGHDAEAVAQALEAAKKSDRPSLIACKTVIGFGAPTKANSHDCHGAPLGAKEIEGAREKLGWPHAPFEVPAPILNAWRAAGAKGAKAFAAWEERFSALDASARETFLRTQEGKLPGGYAAATAAYKKKLIDEKPNWASRKASQEVLGCLTGAVEELIGGSADLTGSNLTKTAHTASITPTDFSGRYLHYGIREFGMATAMNGIALHGGFIPYGGTFFVFSDYLRSALRSSALMNQRVVYVLTHDSIGLGEDGPTHQPVEHLASLRAMPNVLVMRPADSLETLECWMLALEHHTGPTCLVLSRQNLAALRVTETAENLCGRGAYVLAEATGARKVTLLATGSEVGLAMEARKQLEAEGIGAAVVSMPCWELFEQQSAEYKASVLGKGTVRIGIEAAAGFGWDRYIGENGAFIGMTGFGASAPADQLYKHFGITAEAAVAAAKARL